MFYIDEDLDGPRFTDRLAAAAIPFVRHRDHFPQGVVDAEWIPNVTEQGLIIVSANTRMKFNTIEVLAIRSSRARMLYLHQGTGTTHEGLADLLVRSLHAVTGFFAMKHRPRVGVLKRMSHSKDPTGSASGYIEVPKRFR